MQSDRVFTASVRVIAFYRVRPVLFVTAGAYMAWLVTAGGQLLSDIHRMPFLWLILLTLITVGPAFLAWVTWRRVPWGATGGVMRIGASGVEYCVGPDRIRIDWTRIAAVHPVPMVRHTDLVAVRLPVRDDAETVAPTDAELRKILHGAAYRPVQRPDGLLLPVELFGTTGAAQILAALRGHLEQKRPDG